MRHRSTTTGLFLCALASSLAACSGGGGGSAVPASPGAQTYGQAATGQSAGAAQSVATGVVVDLPYDATPANPGYSVLADGSPAPAGAPIAGARVFIGPAVVNGIAAPDTAPAGFVSATTDANGAFRMPAAVAGRLAITIFAPAPHTATLHQVFDAARAANGTYELSAPTDAETAWLARTNADRARWSVAPVALDESALESARYWSRFMESHAYFAHCIPASLCKSGDTTAPPSSYGAQDVDPQHRFAYFHGFSGASAGENIAAGFAAWPNVENAFLAEQSACPNGSPVNCPFTEATGHFLNVVDPHYVWTGYGMTTGPDGNIWYDQEFANVYSPTPTSARHAPERFAAGKAP